MRLKNQRVLIVGASRGLGFATAYFAMKDGAAVAINARDKKKLDALVRSLSGYGKVFGIAGDALTDSKKIVNEAAKRLGGLDHVSVMVGGYEEDTIEAPKSLEAMLANHIKAPVLVANAAVGRLNRGSSITLVSSIKGISKASPNQLSYGIGKAGTAKLVEILSSELLGRGIRINAIAPHSIKGDFEPERNWKRLRKLGDMSAPPEDFARVIVWLMTDEAEFVNGATIPMDGGLRFS
ncbi:MAG: SDR family oxidoreductase [Candidatus Micrarchaeota archaeon]|nr:SDR family oxidoreductase [Candidatus Micrarchaeota archaeon]